MQHIIKTLALTTLFTTISTNASASDVLTGDTRLACEAVLCLSSSTRPGECSPALRRYFGIKFKKPWKTIEARTNFLNQCHASNEPNMPALIQAIAAGAGNCDAKFLNQYNHQTAYRTQCTTSSVIWGNEDNKSCTTTEVSVISPTKPAYCQAYENHEFTDLLTKYVGDPFTGGRWADAKDYDRELQNYNDHYSAIPKGVTYSLENPNGAKWYERDSR